MRERERERERENERESMLTPGCWTGLGLRLEQFDSSDDIRVQVTSPSPVHPTKKQIKLFQMAVLTCGWCPGPNLRS